MTDLPPALRSLIEGKNAELQQHHYDARIGNYQGSRVQNVRDVLDQWAPEPGTPLHALWTQVDAAIRQYEDEIDAIRRESYRDIPGIDTGAPRD
ncbi:MAG: hypothetical protein HOZ81_05050 [Streptomyces sp.]|nr:hypothetical protein [Streptomyces sp.]